MADWKAHYLSALKAQGELEKADADIYDTYTKLADRNAELKAELRKLRAASKVEGSTSPFVPASLISYGFRRSTSVQNVVDDAVAKLRQEFAETQQARVTLQDQVASLQKRLDEHEARFKIGSRKISQLTSSTTQLSMKLRDKEEELRSKATFLQNVQDENATLNLELKVAEQNVAEVKEENKQLVKRWVDKMGTEVDKMNKASGYT